MKSKLCNISNFKKSIFLVIGFSFLSLPNANASGPLAMPFGVLGIVDVVAPTVVRVSGITLDGSYSASSNVEIAVLFSEPVVVTGIPRLLLETGVTDRFADYQSGSGSYSIIFRYTVQAGDSTPWLDYKSINSLELNSGTIKDKAGNVAVLALPSVGSSASLMGQKRYTINTDAATPLQVTSFISSNIGFKIRFNQVLDLKSFYLFSSSGASLDLVIKNPSNISVYSFSAIIDSDGQGINVLSSETLTNGVYSFTLSSGINGTFGANGGQLDGNADGTPGDNYTNTFTVNIPVGPKLIVESSSLGPLQSLNYNATRSMGITLSSAPNMTNLTFTINYDPAVMALTGLSGGDLPIGSVVTTTFPTVGVMNVELVLAGLPSSSAYRIGNLTGSIPASAPFLQAREISISTASQTGASGSLSFFGGVFSVSFLGNTDKNTLYETDDVTNIQRVGARSIAGMDDYKLTSTLVYMDLSKNGAVNSADALTVRNFGRDVNGGRGGTTYWPAIPFKYQVP